MEIRTNEPMARHTSFRVGGPADRFVIPKSETELREAVLDCKKSGQPWYMIGNGSNLLVGDKGFRGTIISTERLAELEVQKNENIIIAGAGVMLSKLANTAAREELTGLEFAAGIPGTVGGGAVMNAGAYGGEMSQVVSTVTVVNRNGEIMELDNGTMEFGYRTSVIQNQPFVVTKVTFRLEQGDPEQIAEKMADLAKRRREKQPLEYPSAGSTFKRPAGHFAGQLIMESGLRGYSVGGAKVSEKHCGFIINTGNATAEDVKDVIWEVQRRVKERFQVDLEPEIKFL